MLLNDYLSKNAKMLQGCSVIELGSGVGITGILCSRFCHDFVLTDHNDEVLKILKKNIELHASPENPNCCAGEGNKLKMEDIYDRITSYIFFVFNSLYAGLVAEKLEWGNSDQINEILHKYSGGFDLVLGADICFQQASIPLLFDTVKQILQIKGKGQCKFILAYVSRAKIMDSLVISEATRHGMQITEVAGTRCVVGNHDGVIFEVTLQ
ncbi:hypothetical protein FH972_009900 [Carpinus fangiana]|uniref:Methyltransferase small domain-containing protein n=1 Tax=Carpinus fangiana TaxID=176857 RepID=A0A660KNK4_9ROSI|nr:hypothetical protein FH972_009900 [Carpinus fangiana]